MTCGLLVWPCGKFSPIVKNSPWRTWMKTKFATTWNTGSTLMVLVWLHADLRSTNALKKCLTSSGNVGVGNRKKDPFSWKFTNFCKTSAWDFLWTEPPRHPINLFLFKPLYHSFLFTIICDKLVNFPILWMCSPHVCLVSPIKIKKKVSFWPIVVKKVFSGGCWLPLVTLRVRKWTIPSCGLIFSKRG